MMTKATPDSVRVALQRTRAYGPIDMPAAAYHGMTDFVSHSTLKKMESTPAKFRWDMDHPRSPSAAMQLGTAIHAAVLEPDVFDATYRVRRDKPVEPERPPELADVTRRSKEGKAALDAWEATWKPAHDAALAEWERERATLNMLSQDDMDTVLRVHQRATTDEYFARYLGHGVGVREASFFARDPATGLLLRCRCDNYIPETHTIVDLKTTDSAGEYAFTSDIFKYGYHVQAAFYSDVLALVFGRAPKFTIIAAEKSRDCDLREFVLDEEAIEYGRTLYREWLAALARCMKTNEWMGYARAPVSVRLPKWIKATPTSEEEAPW